MPRLDLRPAAARGALTPQERRLVDLLLAQLNELRAALGLPARTLAEVEHWLQDREKGT